MVGQQQGPNQIESPANLLQQPHNYEVQVSLLQHFKEFTNLILILTKFIQILLLQILTCVLECTSDITPTSTHLNIFYSPTKLKFNLFQVTQYMVEVFPPLNPFQFVSCLFTRHIKEFYIYLYCMYV